MDQFKIFLNKITPISDKEYDESILYFQKVDYKRGDFFVKSNTVCKYIGFILKGTFRIYYQNEKAEEITSCFCSENNFTTSYKSFILQQPSNLILQAIEDSQLIVINYENLQKLYAKSILWQQIGRTVAEREYLIMEKYASILNNETAKEKYLRLLNEQPNVLQKATIEDIASYLGVTRRTLSRIRQEISQQ